MDNLLKAFGNMTLSSVLTVVSAFCFIAAFVLKIRDFIIDQHDKKLAGESRMLELCSEFSELRDDLRAYMKRQDKLEKNLEKVKSYQLASLRDKIFKDYQLYTSRNEITDLQLTNFDANVEEYTNQGGNSSVLHKYAPEVRDLPVVDGK